MASDRFRRRLCIYQLNEIAVSDRATLRGLTQFLTQSLDASPQIGEDKSICGTARFEGGFCATLFRTARNSLILSGEMSEWLKEHAWKSKRLTGIKPFRRLSTHTRSATSRSKSLTRCAPVSRDVSRGFEPDVSQSYHNRVLHLRAAVSDSTSTNRKRFNEPED